VKLSIKDFREAAAKDWELIGNKIRELRKPEGRHSRWEHYPRPAGVGGEAVVKHSIKTILFYIGLLKNGWNRYGLNERTPA